MCSACITISPCGSNSAVEASRRSLMLAECAARISTAPISSQIACSAPVRTWSCDRVDHAAAAMRIVPLWSTRPDHPSGTSSVDSGSSTTVRGESSVPGGGAPRSTSSPTSAPARTARRCPRCTVSVWVRFRESHVGAAGDRGHADRHELERLLGVAVAVSVFVHRLERRAQLRRVGVDAGPDRQLERLAAVAQLVRGAELGVRIAERAARAARRAACVTPAIAAAVNPLTAEQHAALNVTAPWGDDQPERREHARGAGADDRARSRAHRRSPRHAAGRRRRTRAARIAADRSRAGPSRLAARGPSPRWRRG